MPNASEIEQFLVEFGIPVVGTVVRDSEGDPSYYVFVEVQTSSRGRQEPSNFQLEQAKASIRDKGAFVDFVLTNSSTRDAEAGLRASLLHSFGSEMRNAFLSTQGNRGYVWLVPKRVLTDAELEPIAAKAKVFLDNVGLELAHLTPTTGENLPSKTRCLMTLRLAAPVAAPQLAELLRANGFVVPSEDWMARRLDALRKSGFAVRMKSGFYAVSLSGLKALGTVKGRTSPDISRLLALAGKRG